MNVISAYVLGQSLKSGFDNDLLTDTQKNISNWTVTGSTSASINYSNKVNTLTFSSSITPATTAQQFVDGFARLGITCSLATAQDIVTKINSSKWTGHPSTPWSIAFMVGKKDNNDVIAILPYYTGLGTISFVPHPNVSGYTVPVYGNVSDYNYLTLDQIYYYNTSSNTIGNFSQGYVSSTSALENVTKSGTLSVYTTIDRDYTLNFDIPDFDSNDNKKYVLQLNQLTSTGYDKDSSIHDITLTNDTDTYTIDFNNTISQEYSKSNIIFTPTVAACTLKLNLRGMKGSGVDLKLKDISLYELQ